ncbi:MAG: FadR/GntR family transcriptional regulator [Bacillota bacterium]
MSNRFQPVVTESRSRSERIVSQIKSLMFEGKLKPGDKLPPERELAEIMNVSRTSVREAIKTLSAMGLVAIRKGHGVFVAEANLGTVINKVGDALILKKDEIEQLFEIRKVLETQAAHWAAERATEDEISYINRLVSEAKDACRHPDTCTDIITSHDTKFHNAVIDASHNNVLGMVMSGLLEALTRVRARTMRLPGRVAQSVLDHEAIAKAITSRDGNEASTAMYRHIESVEKSIKENETYNN